MLFILPQSLTEGINGAQKTDDSSHFSTPLKDTSLLCLLIVFCRTLDPTTWQKHIVNGIRFIDWFSIRREFKLGSLSEVFVWIKYNRRDHTWLGPYRYEKAIYYEFAMHLRHNSIFRKEPVCVWRQFRPFYKYRYSICTNRWLLHVANVNRNVRWLRVHIGN